MSLKEIGTVKELEELAGLDGLGSRKEAKLRRALTNPAREFHQPT